MLIDRWKGQAKKLRKACAAGDPAALARVRAALRDFDENRAIPHMTCFVTQTDDVLATDWEVVATSPQAFAKIEEGL